MEKPDCRNCSHYYVTWNPKTPQGCRRYGIQSKEKPSLIVARAGAGGCQGFELSKRKKNSSQDLRWYEKQDHSGEGS